MLDFLKDYSIDERTIYSLEDTLSDSMLFNINCNELEIEKEINFFREIGINSIDDLLLNNIELFLLTFSEIKNKFEKYDIPRLVELINSDSNVISQI